MKIYLIILLSLPLFYTCTDEQEQEAPYLTLQETDRTQHFTQNKETVEIPVSTNLQADAWQVSSDSEWCVAAKSVSSGNSFKISVPDSEEADLRSAVVTVASTAGNVTIQVNQLGYGPAILAKSSLSAVSYTGGMVEVEVVSNIEYQLVKEKLEEWVVPGTRTKGFTESDFSFEITANPLYIDRTGGILFQGIDYPGIEALCEIQQKAVPSGTSDIQIEGDIQLKVTGGTASEFQPGYSIEKSFDGKIGDTHYHSRWYDDTELPVTLEYFFDGTEDLEYLIYHSRNGNGNFGELELFVQSAGEDSYRKIGSYDFEMKNGSRKLVLPEPAAKVQKVKFLVSTGAGGYVSCDEMEFFRKNDNKILDQQLLTVFTDITCTALKPDVTYEQIQTLPGYFARIASLLKNDLYDPFEKSFRIRDYQPYSNVEAWARQLMTKKYSNLDNPTGIYVQAGDTIVVLVGPTNGTPVSLMSIQEEKNGDYMQIPSSGVTYYLEEGVNKIGITRDGDLFLMYTAHPQQPPVRIHIPPGSGTVNGFFDLKEHQTDTRYAELLRTATHKYFMVRGEKIMFYFHRSKLLEYVPNQILSAITLWDNIISWQQELMGIEDVRPSEVNNHILAISPEGSYMWASDYRVGFVYTYLNNILLYDNVMAAKDNAWGPAHEIGHVHQWAINWAGSTESSNNLFSNYILYKLGKYTSRGTELCLPDPDDNRQKNTLAYIRYVCKNPWVDFGSGHQNENTELHMRMNWQLWTYYHRCGHKPDFWPALFKLMRDNRLETVESAQDPGAKQMLFARMASQAAQEDLSEFFERWGFFVPVDMNIEQYGTWRYRVTQSIIDETKRFMARYPKARPFYYIEDRKNGDAGLDNVPPDVGYYTQFAGAPKPVNPSISYSRNGRTFRIANGHEAVGFEIRRGTEILYFSTFFEFTVPDEISLDNITVQAVQSDGTRIPLM